MPPPQDKKGVERLLGMLKYVAKFIPDMSSIIQPIRELVKKEVHFIWEWEQEVAFKKIKEKLSVAPALTFFNVKKPTTISCDASQSGLGAVLMQNNRPVAYASCALTSAETRYAQIETELLAVVFALEKFHQYIYGTNVEIESDHTCTATPLSRAYIPDISTDRMEDELMSAVHMVLENAPAIDKGIQKIKELTESDNTLQKLKSIIRSGIDLSEDVQSYWNFRNELSEAEGIILKGEKIVIPTSLRKDMLTRIHRGHLGIVKCIQRVREAIYWPGDIEEMLGKCEICQRYRESNSKEPLISEPIPDKP
ncbi:hypothetical protein EMCRGX_G029693 [Ephydatia muelleri]